MVDLGHGDAERRQPRFLPERGTQFILHHRQLALGDADFVGAPAGRDHPGRIFRRGAKPRHALGDAAHRPNHQQMHAQVNQAGGKKRNDDGEIQNPPRIIPHGRPHGGFVDQDFDGHFRVFRRRPDDAENPVFSLAQGRKSIEDKAEKRTHTHVDGQVDLGRHVLRYHQHPPLRPVEHDAVGCGVKQQHLFEVFIDFLIRHVFDGQHRKVGAGDVLFQIDLAVTRHRRRPDQEFRQHDEENRQQQKPKR